MGFLNKDEAREQFNRGKTIYFGPPLNNVFFDTDGYSKDIGFDAIIDSYDEKNGIDRNNIEFSTTKPF
jgi:hypothetical protein